MEEQISDAVAFLDQEEVFVWDAETVSKLRRHQRIVLPTIGCLPRCARQNIHFGLPAKVSPNQVTLLIEQGSLSLEEYVPGQPLSDEDMKTFDEARAQAVQQQAEEYCVFRQEQLFQRQISSESGSGQVTEEMEASPKQAAEDEETTNESSSSKASEDRSQLLPAPSALSKPGIRSPVTSMIKVHFKDPRAVRGVQPTWNYPRSQEEVQRSWIFKDLWRKGYFVTTGINYGADFLIYDGDPFMVHSCSMVLVLPWRQSWSMRELVAAGRMATKVRKTVLLCSVHPESNQVKSFTVQWTGIV